MIRNPCLTTVYPIEEVHCADDGIENLTSYDLTDEWWDGAVCGFISYSTYWFLTFKPTLFVEGFMWITGETIVISWWTLT